jgi:hypothetical protein
MKAQEAAAMASAAPHAAHGMEPCACEQQTLGATPWVMGALVLFLAWRVVRGRTKTHNPNKYTRQ